METLIMVFPYTLDVTHPSGSIAFAQPDGNPGSDTERANKALSALSRATHLDLLLRGVRAQVSSCASAQAAHVVAAAGFDSGGKHMSSYANPAEMARKVGTPKDGTVEYTPVGAELSTAIAALTRLTHLRLKNMHVDSAEAVRLAAALRQLGALESLEIPDIIVERTTGKHAVGPVGGRFILDAHEGLAKAVGMLTRVTRLSMSCTLATQSIARVGSFLGAVLGPLTALRRLDIASAEPAVIYPDAGQALGALTSLEYLSLSTHSLNRAQVLQMVAHVQALTQLCVLRTASHPSHSSTHGMVDLLLQTAGKPTSLQQLKCGRSAAP
jgi:hypothetical protein